jgi:hypothetical protein
MEKLHCPYCNTVIRRSSAYVDECPMFARHLDRCERATERERSFYGAHRRWPPRSPSRRRATAALSANPLAMRHMFDRNT